jgi:hypothetical protein
MMKALKLRRELFFCLLIKGYLTKMKDHMSVKPWLILNQSIAVTTIYESINSIGSNH